MTAPVHYRAQGHHQPRQGRWVVLVAFWITMATLCVTGVVVALIQAPSPPASPCPPPKLCGGPSPVLPASSTRTWVAGGRRASLQYPVAVFSVQQRSASTLRLQVRASRPSGVEASVWVTVDPLRAGTPEALLRHRQSVLAASILGLTTDQSAETIIPPPHVGDVAGVGGSYRGTVDTPQGPGGQVVAILAAATDGHSSAVVSYVVTGTDNPTEIEMLRAYLSPILTSFTWAPR